MLLLLKLAVAGKEHTPREVVEALAKEFDLTEEDHRQMLPSGRQATFDNRVAWAKAMWVCPLSLPMRLRK